MIAYSLYRAALDVYGVLSFEFESIDVVKRKVESKHCVHFYKMLHSISFIIFAIKNKCTKKDRLVFLLEIVILALARLKMADRMEPDA
jgi:hypothetical protein